MNKIIEPSLLSLLNKPYNEAISCLKTIASQGLQYVHYDVMDGQFVPNKALDQQYLKEIEKFGLKATVHLMVNNPQVYLDKYLKFSLEALTFHVEPLTIDEIKKYLLQIKASGVKCGIAIKMETDLNNYQSLLSLIDYITIMSVPPGKAGQKYDNKCLRNLQVASKFKQLKPNIIVQLDGGINLDTAKQNYQYVDSFIMGSYFFDNLKNISSVIKTIKNKTF